MIVAFRADASQKIGSGHIMRCLTLANGLRAQGHKCLFIVRSDVGDLTNLIVDQGFEIHALMPNSMAETQLVVGKYNDELPSHATWLNVSWQQDARQTAYVLASRRVDWLVVDHYALDYRWQVSLCKYFKKLLVIDDLADRKHDRPDILVDQTLSRSESDYLGLVDEKTQLLLGVSYCLLREEFARQRVHALVNRRNRTQRRILLNLGGVDQCNLTAKILKTLANSRQAWRDYSGVDVVLGAANPNVELVTELASRVPYDCSVIVNSQNMAELMSCAAIAIGAAGATSWERCCLGLPTIMIVIADNQKLVAKSLQDAGAAIGLKMSEIDDLLPDALHRISGDNWQQYSEAAASLVDGLGSARVVKEMQL